MQDRATAPMRQAPLSLNISEEKEASKTDESIGSSSNDDKDTKPSKNNIKKHVRSQSPEIATFISISKRRTYRGPTLEHVSEVAMVFEAVYIADSVGEMPTTFESARKSSDSGMWIEACNLEFDSLQRNDTWASMPLSRARQAIRVPMSASFKKNDDSEV